MIEWAVHGAPNEAVASVLLLHSIPLIMALLILTALITILVSLFHG